MQPELKFSRFMFHLKFSRTDDYVHEHELYEVMKSRNLYQTQFGLRSNYQKIMRLLTKDEKQRKYNFENTRKLFVQKMRERREQVDKLRNRMSLSINSLSDLDDAEKKTERRYVSLPRSRIVYPSMPALNTAPDFMSRRTPQGTSRFQDAITLPPAAPSPSMVATNLSGPMETFTRTLSSHDMVLEDIRPRAKSLPAKYMIVSRGSPKTLTTNKKALPDSEESTSNDTELMQQNEDLVNELNALARKHNEEETTADTIKAPHESTVCFADIENDTKKKSDMEPQMLSSQSQTKEWAEKHGISKSKMNIQIEQDFQRLMIDRPSKWALDHVHRENTQSNVLEQRHRQSTRIFDDGSRRQINKQHMLKVNQKPRPSLPELDTTPKPMVTLNPGGTTPDGRLILTKADYDDYLADYRKARTCRLEQSKKKNKHLSRKVENFSVDPQLCLRDETCLRASLRTI